jgi:hypothetical protein
MVDGGGAWEGSEKGNPNPNNTRPAFRPCLKLRLQGFLFFFLNGALVALVKEFVDAVLRVAVIALLLSLQVFLGHAIAVVSVYMHAC